MKNISSKILLTLLLPAGWAGAQQAVPVSLQPAPGGNYTVENVQELNTQFLDYCAVPFGGGVVFTSARGSNGVFVCDQDLATGRYSDLYFAKQDAEGRFFYPDMLHGDINGKYHDGAATFTPDGRTMIFSRNNLNGQSSTGLIDLKIYTANWSDGDWVGTQELPFNGADFATCHPTLTANGQLLFFASNRPGGYGGMDIYVSKKEGESWGAPINLGPDVNSGGHEIFPFISADNTLYFSSDGPRSRGGLDVFSAAMKGILPGEAMRLSAPVNSAYDDFAFTADRVNKVGFLTSNRPGGKGQDDIYRWKFSGVRPVMASICVVEKNTGNRINDATLRIQPADGNSTGLGFGQNQISITPDGQYVVLYADGFPSTGSFSKSCEVKVPVVPGENYQLEVNKEGYQPMLLQVTAAQLTAESEYLVPIEKPATAAFTGVVRNKATNAPLPSSTVKVFNRCTGKVYEFSTDAKGNFRFDFDCRCEYGVVAEKDGFDQQRKLWKAGEINCNERLPAVTLYLAPEAKAAPVLEVGTVIELENVYYDYNQFFIRSDAAADLDHVVDLMKKYPSLEIELGSHTDARGSDSYNVRLSQQRAEAAVKYVVSKGISKRRLSARGYGETRLVNHCNNEVECSEEEHQENRRTEIKITRLEEKGVKY
ncbi:MAG: PD40 domain-containing protein [Bacteroidetes bacterium]|nr:PD40 domain-containing protein [Bacteroidota bacterium]